MANNSKLYMTISYETAKTLKLLKAPKPWCLWDSELGSYSDEQETTANGAPLWKATAMISLGWTPEKTPVVIRFPYWDGKPKLDADPAFDSDINPPRPSRPSGGANSGSAAPTPKPRMSAPQARSVRP